MHKKPVTNFISILKTIKVNVKDASIKTKSKR